MASTIYYVNYYWRFSYREQTTEIFFKERVSMINSCIFRVRVHRADKHVSIFYIPPIPGVMPTIPCIPKSNISLASCTHRVFAFPCQMIKVDLVG